MRILNDKGEIARCAIHCEKEAKTIIVDDHLGVGDGDGFTCREHKIPTVVQPRSLPYPENFHRVIGQGWLMELKRIKK